VAAPDRPRRHGHRRRLDRRLRQLGGRRATTATSRRPASPTRPTSAARDSSRRRCR
jgi:hypothetical protein